MTTQELFAEIVKKRTWYKPLGYSVQQGGNIKCQFLKGTLSETTMFNILTKLGYVKNVNWELKKENDES